MFVIIANFESRVVQIVPRHFQPGSSRGSGLTRTSTLILTIYPSSPSSVSRFPDRRNAGEVHRPSFRPTMILRHSTLHRERSGVKPLTRMTLVDFLAAETTVEIWGIPSVGHRVEDSRFPEHPVALRQRHSSTEQRPHYFSAGQKLRCATNIETPTRSSSRDCSSSNPKSRRKVFWLWWSFGCKKESKSEEGRRACEVNKM